MQYDRLWKAVSVLQYQIASMDIAIGVQYRVDVEKRRIKTIKVSIDDLSNASRLLGGQGEQTGHEVIGLFNVRGGDLCLSSKLGKSRHATRQDAPRLPQKMCG